jgi:hypothetical protein
MNQVLAPDLAADETELVRPRPGFTPKPRRVDLVRLAHRWTRLPGEFGQLECHVDLDNTGLRIAEVRLVASHLKLPGWQAADEEPG